MRYTKLFIAGILTVSTGANAQNLGQQIQLCSQESDSLKRLVCYDGVAKSLKHTTQPSTQNTNPVPVPRQPVQTAAVAPLPQSANLTASKQESEFGLENLKSKGPEDADKILVNLTEKQKDKRKKWILTFDNGQVWKQSDSQNYYFPDGQLYIERGMFGSYFFGSESANRRMRVKRIK